MKEYKVSFMVIILSFLSFFIYSCDPGLYDPYSVSESRQKENVYYAPSAQNVPLTEQMKIIHDQSRHLMWEPGLLLRAGWENILFQAGFSFSSDLTNKDFYHDKTNFSIGMIFKGNVGKSKKRNFKETNFFVSLLHTKSYR